MSLAMSLACSTPWSLMLWCVLSTVTPTLCSSARMTRGASSIYMGPLCAHSPTSLRPMRLTWWATGKLFISVCTRMSRRQAEIATETSIISTEKLTWILHSVVLCNPCILLYVGQQWFDPFLICTSILFDSVENTTKIPNIIQYKSQLSLAMMNYELIEPTLVDLHYCTIL